MELYIGIYTLVWFICILASFRVKKSFLLILSVCVIAVCFQGLRWRTGSDWIPYLDCFLKSNEYQVGDVEFGYYWINKFVRCFTSSYTIFLLVESTIIFGCIWKFATEFKACNIPVVISAFFATSIFPVRFTLACAIFMLSYKYIRDRKFFHFAIIYVIASSIHQIVALTLPLYFISARTYKGKALIITYLACCGVGLLTDWVFNNLLSSLDLVFAFLPKFSQDKAMAYMNIENESRSLLTNMISFLNGVVFIFLFLKIRNTVQNVTGYNVLLNMYVFGLSISRIFLNTIPYLARINMCCSGGFSIMLLWGIYRFKRYRPLLVSFFAVYVYFSFSKQIAMYPDLFIPYYSVFSITKRAIVY